VTAVYFKEGSNVSKGQLLLQMNAQDLQAQLKKVQSQCKMKELTLNRAKLLLKEGGISEENFEQVETEYLSAQADVELIKEQIKKTQIFAPFSGTIGISSVDVGSYLTTNSAIVALQQTQQLKLDFSIPEKYAALIKPNMEVSFATESSAQQFQAKIVAVEPAIDANTRNRNVRAIFQNNQQACVPGSFAKVFVNMALNKNAILVPTTCIVPILKGQKVYVAQGDSVVNRNVVVGERLDSMVEVVEGLYNGESVVYKGVIQLKPGSKIISK
jgi:membrane fusion protein (multidrug efflux system)